MEIDSKPVNRTFAHFETSKQPAFGAKFLSVTQGREPHKIKKKFKPLLPKLSERSKVIGKGTSYSEKLEKRKVAKGYAGPSMGGNRLNQKKMKDKFKVPGMALT